MLFRQQGQIDHHLDSRLVGAEAAKEEWIRKRLGCKCFDSKLAAMHTDDCPVAADRRLGTKSIYWRLKGYVNLNGVWVEPDSTNFFLVRTELLRLHETLRCAVCSRVVDRVTSEDLPGQSKVLFIVRCHGTEEHMELTYEEIQRMEPDSIEFAPAFSCRAG